MQSSSTRTTISDKRGVAAFLKAAAQIVEPAELSQRKMFEEMMPLLYSIRDKGCSWPQITELLAQAGLNLQPSTVRSYYSEMLARRQDICQARMTEQILWLAEVKKQKDSAEDEALKTKLIAFVKDTPGISEETSAKIDAAFGPKKTNPPSENSGARTSASDGTLSGEKIFEGLRPSPGTTGTPAKKPAVNAPVVGTPVVEKKIESGFGLLATSATTSTANKPKTGFFADLVAPEIPNLTAQPDTQSTTEIQKLTCLPLTSGVPPLKKRPEVDPACYMPGQIEHPAIAGLVLSLDERLYGAYLEYAGDDGKVKLESAQEKRFRIKWTKPIKMTISSTDSDFTNMDYSIFGKNG